VTLVKGMACLQFKVYIIIAIILNCLGLSPGIIIWLKPSELINLNALDVLVQNNFMSSSFRAC